MLTWHHQELPCVSTNVNVVVWMLMVMVLLALMLEFRQVHLHRKPLVGVTIQHSMLPLLNVGLVVHAEGIMRRRLGPGTSGGRGSIGVECYARRGDWRSGSVGEISLSLLVKEELSGSLLEPERTIGHLRSRTASVVCSLYRTRL